MKTSCRGGISVICTLACFLLPTSLMAEPVPLKRIVELALSHATGSAIAAADEERMNYLYRELHNNYVPQLSVGAGLGPPSYGFPLALEGQAPSLFTLNAQSTLLNPSLREFMHAAKIDIAVATLNTKDQRSQIIQDAAQSYEELAKWERRLSMLQEAEIEANRMEAAVQERVKEGIDSELEGTKARLSAARVHFRVAQAQGSADVLREHLSKLTGLPAAGIQTDPDTIPSPPPLPASDETARESLASNPSIEAAVDHARAQYLRAQGEHRALWPSFDLAGQYALLSQFNNFQHYYIPEKLCVTSIGTFLCPAGGFHQNNATVGVSIRFSFLNASQRSRAKAADADAVRASKQAEAARDKLSEETLRLQRSVVQMQAERDVAQLEYEIAQKNLAVVKTRMDAGTANLHDLDDADSQVNERFISLQDVTFELQRAHLGLMRSTGDLEKWALGR